MNVKAQRKYVTNLLIMIVSIYILTCGAGSGALAQEGGSLDKVKKQLNELQEKIASMVSVPVGTIMAYGGDLSDAKVKENLESQGWLPCDGESYSVEDKKYKELYDAIGTAFGGNVDNRTFNVPDLRGRFLRGVDQGQKRDPDAASRRAEPGGANSGDKVGSVQEDEFKKHSHQYQKFPDGHGGYPSGKYWNINFNAQTGEAGGSETRPKNIYVNWIIKAKHTLPAAP